MTQRRLAARASVLVVFVGALVIKLPQANACSPLPLKTRALVADGAHIPANVQGVPVALSFNPSAADASERVQVLDASSKPIATTLQVGTEYNGALVVPQSPFALGTYRLALTPSPAETSPPPTSFTIVAAAPLPTTAPVIELGKPFRWTAPLFGAPCVDQVDSAVVDVTVRLGEDYRPYQDVLELENRSDGTPDKPLVWAVSPTQATYPVAGLPSLTATYRVTIACANAPGAGGIQLSARLRGFVADPITATARVEMPSCSTLAAVPVGAGGAPTGGGEQEGAIRNEEAVPAEGAASADGGCSASSRSGGDGAALFVIAATALLRRSRQRRGRPSA